MRWGRTSRPRRGRYWRGSTEPLGQVPGRLIARCDLGVEGRRPGLHAALAPVAVQVETQVGEHQQPRAVGIAPFQRLEDLAVLRDDAEILRAAAAAELPRGSDQALAQRLLDDRQEGLDRRVLGRLQ